MATLGLKLINTLGTFNLTPSNNISVQSINESIPSKINMLNIPRRHGVAIDNPLKMSPRIISLVGLIRGSTKEGYRTSVDAFRKNIEFGGRQQFWKFDDRYINVQKTDCQIRDHIAALSGEFAVDLICDDPFWYASAAETPDIQTTSATSLTYSITNSGNAPVYPKITLSATGEWAQIVNNTVSGKLWKYDPVTSATNIVVDHALFTCTDDGVNVLSNLTGEFWELNPGANSLTFTQPSGVSLTITTEFTKRWY